MIEFEDIKSENEKLEIARLIAECKSASAVKAICDLYGIKNVVTLGSDYSDSVSEWLKSVTDLNGVKVEAAYSDYLMFCKENRIESYGVSTFSKRLHGLAGLVVRRRRENGELKGFYYPEI